jgi:hypothetical protein
MMRKTALSISSLKPLQLYHLPQFLINKRNLLIYSRMMMKRRKILDSGSSLRLLLLHLNPYSQSYQLLVLRSQICSLMRTMMKMRVSSLKLKKLLSCLCPCHQSQFKNRKQNPISSTMMMMKRTVLCQRRRQI